MASTEPSRRASVASSSEMSLQEPTSNKTTPAKKEKATGGVNLKKSIAKKAKPKTTENNGNKTGGTTRSPSPDSPAVNGTGPKPNEGTETVICKHCKKPMSESVYTSHAPLCLEKKKEKARKKKEAKEAKLRDAKAREAAEEKEKEKDADSVMDDIATAVGGGEGAEEGGSTKKPPKKSASKNASDGTKKSKKRKAGEGDGDKEPKKKKLKKDEPPKPKLPKPKGPVNVETQCGVYLDKTDSYCARSLTCKSHSMGAKRGVPGRSLPYDQLLAMYQKRNQAKLQKQALSQAAPLPDEEPTNGPVDSDEEKDAVMAAIARSRPVPLEQHTFVPTSRKYKYIRLKEMLGNALGVKGGLLGGAKAGNESLPSEGGGLPTAAHPVESVNGEGTSRKASMVSHGPGQQSKAGTASANAAPSRKASVASNGGT